jgi:hypothetical protein
MAQTKRKRKHRGNAAGIVERHAHNATGTRRRPQSKEDVRAEARQRRVDRMNRPPSWKAAAQRAAIAAGLFAVLIVLVFKEKPGNALSLAAFMLVLYIPLSYLTDKALYTWRQKKRASGPQG